MTTESLERELLNRLVKYKNIKTTLDLNYKNIPCNIIEISEKGVKTWNELVGLLHVLDFKRLVRTKSGGISISQKNFRGCYGYDVRALKSCIELTIVFHYCVRIQFRNNFKEDTKNDISGSTAYRVFKNTLDNFGIDISDWFIENGKEVKETIEKPLVYVRHGKEEKLWKNNVHHIDIHSAYMGAIAEKVPEWRPAINKIYEERELNEVNKGILTHSFGYFQSSIFGYKLAHLSKFAVERTKRKLEELTERINETGSFVLAYNTDGIWYYGDIYHGEGEGKGLGQWSNDYINGDIWFNSIGQYAFKGTNVKTGKQIEKIVARGRYALDKIKPRNEWNFDDIMYKRLGAESLYTFDKDTELISKLEGEVI